MKRSLFSTFLLCILLSKCFAQNEYYSQFYNARQELNPALTGHLINDWRLQDVFGYRDYLFGKSYTANQLDLEVKFPVAKRSFFYGVVEEDFTNLIIGLGFSDQRHRLGFDTSDYGGDYLSAAIHKKILKDAQISFGLNVGIFRYQKKSIFDYGAGILFAKKRIDCEYANQIFKFEFGLAYQHISQKFTSAEDTLLLPTANIQGHVGWFFKLARKINMEPMAQVAYNGRTYANVGFYIISRSKHPTSDGLRFGVFYRSTQHLALKAGLRLFGSGDQTLAADLTAAYDINLMGLYKNGFEISLAIYPLKKCWKVMQCIPNK